MCFLRDSFDSVKRLAPVPSICDPTASPLQAAILFTDVYALAGGVERIIRRLGAARQLWGFAAGSG